MTHSMNEIGAPCRIHESIRFHFMIEHDCQMTKSQITFLRLDSKSAVEGCYKVEHEMELYVSKCCNIDFWPLLFYDYD